MVNSKALRRIIWMLAAIFAVDLALLATKIRPIDITCIAIIAIQVVVVIYLIFISLKLLKIKE